MRDRVRIRAGEDGPQDRDVVTVDVVADQRAAGRGDPVQGLGEVFPVAVDEVASPVGVQEPEAPAGPREDLRVENHDTLVGIEDVF